MSIKNKKSLFMRAYILTTFLLSLTGLAEATLLEISISGQITNNTTSSSLFSAGDKWMLNVMLDSSYPTGGTCQYAQRCQHAYESSAHLQVNEYVFEFGPNDAFPLYLTMSSPFSDSTGSDKILASPNVPVLQLSASEYIVGFYVDLEAIGRTLFSDPYDFSADELIEISEEDFSNSQVDVFYKAPFGIFIADDPDWISASTHITGNVTEFSVQSVPLPPSLGLFLTSLIVLRAGKLKKKIEKSKNRDRFILRGL